MSHDAQIIHPRPQLTRSRWIDLSGPWQFAYDDEGVGLIEHWEKREDVYTRTIQVPFPPESLASGIADMSFHPILWYQRSFETTEELRRKRLLLHCGAVDYQASVWVNGQLVATHEGGHTPFSADITDALSTNSTQVIVIRAEDMPHDLGQPRGKQDWEKEPHNIWYKRTTGIWQPVWVEPVSSTYISSIRWTPNLPAGSVTLNVNLQRSRETPLQLRVHLSLHGKTLVDHVSPIDGSQIQREIALPTMSTEDPQELLWSPEHPNLIDAELELLTAGGSEDQVQSYLGLRSIDTGSGHFLLNGQPYYLRLVLEQGYWPQSHLAAPSAEALQHEVELIKALGFNGVRIHQKVEDPRFLYWCDRLGLAVWAEMANAYNFSSQAARRLLREWLEVLERDYNHPCIITWVPLNESWGIPHIANDPAEQQLVEAIYHLTKAFDTTRPVIGNDGWEHQISDIISIHDYTASGIELRARYQNLEAFDQTLQTQRMSGRVVLLPGYRRSEEPVMITEFGGTSFRRSTGRQWFDYGTVNEPGAFLQRYRDQIDALLDSKVIVGFCYTQLTDTEQESNGLLTEQRVPKFDLQTLHAITSRPLQDARPEA